MSEPWQPDILPADLHTHDGIAAVTAALRDLGLIKPGEQIVTAHQHGCPAGRPPYPDECTCPGGAELVYADWDELQPVRHYHIPERFYVHN